MKKKAVFLLVAVFLLASVAGCRREPVEPMTTETIQLFYGDAQGEKLVTEEREIRYGKCDDRYKIALEELIKGPADASLTAPISRDTRVYGTILQRRDIIVNVSQEFAQFAGSIAEIIGVGTLVNTLTQFPDIDRVKILVEGEELITPGDFPYGFLEPYPLDPSATTAREVLLYFANADATALLTERRVIQVPFRATNPEIARRVVEELIEGPQTPALKRTIPPEVTVLSTAIAGGICHVDFSEEMHTRHSGGATGEAFTITSLVYSLTELPFVQKVRLTVEGGILTIEHIELENPVGREDVRLP
jgi:germination protein M